MTPHQLDALGDEDYAAMVRLMLAERAELDQLSRGRRQVAASPSIMVRILGDVSKLGSSFSGVAAKGQSAAASMHSAFSGMLGTLNQSGVLGPFGNALQVADMSLQSMGEHAKQLGPKMMGAGGAAMGLGLALSAAGSKDAAAHAQLQAAIGATGKSYDTYAGKIEAAITHQEHFGNTADQTSDSLRILTQATGDPKKALDLLNTATDLAAAKHESLSTAASELGKAYNGSGRVMKEFGITVSATGTAAKELTTATTTHTKAVTEHANALRALQELQAEDATKKSLTTVETMKLQDAQAKVNKSQQDVITSTTAMNTAQKDVATGTSTNSKAIDELGKKLAGQASAQADTFTGHMRSLKAEVEDHIAMFGQKYGPALTAAGAAMTGLGATMTVAKGITSAMRDSEMLAAASTYAWGAAMTVLDAVMDANVITIIILAVIALVAIIAIVITKFGLWKTVVADVQKAFKVAFTDIKAVFTDVFNWIKSHWELLAAILLGIVSPLAAVVLLFVKFHDQIIGFFTKLPGEILTALGDVATLLLQVGKDILTGLWNGLKWVWDNEVAGWLILGPKILAVIGDLLHLLEQLGKDVITGLWTGLKWVWDNEVAGWLNIGAKIKGAVGDLTQLLLQVGKDVLEGLWTGLKWVWDNEVKGWLDIGSKITTAVGDLKHLLEQVGKDIIGGLLNGMKSAWTDVSSWMGNMAGKIKGFITNPLSILSPSHVMMEIGNNIMAGLGIGLQQGFTQHVVPTMASAAGAITGPVSGGATPSGAALHAMPPAQRQAAIVAIEHAHFAQAVDVDAFMRRAAWVAKTRAV